MSSNLRVVFLGSPEFAIPSLRALANHPDIEVALVVTQPDRPSGRGRRLTPPPVRMAADELGLVSMQPETLRDESAIELIRSVHPDVLVVVAYGEILRRAVLSLAPHGCLNVHPSLLPAYRGATPIPAAILHGDNETGVTIIKLIAALDAGPIVAQHAVSLDQTETSGELSDRLADLAAEVLPETMLAYASGDRFRVSRIMSGRPTHANGLAKTLTSTGLSQPAESNSSFEHPIRGPLPGRSFAANGCAFCGACGIRH
ncbi:MAG: methionyl-tRNA formyltransferase [Thermomicrobiales bacterium]|nr:methionyl-tRNA formyltransferase [Thermomicrobiales bacterium]